MASIPELRAWAYKVANDAITTLNNLNDIIFKDMSNRPEKIDNISEDTSNISLKYIQDGIDIYDKYAPEIGEKTRYLEMLFECNRQSYRTALKFRSLYA